MPTVSRVTSAAPGWSDVGRTATAAAPTAANSGLQGGMFGQNTDALMGMYDRAIAAGMTPSRAAQLIGSDISPEQFAAQIQQLEQTKATLGDPVFTPARTAEQTATRNQQSVQDIAAQLQAQNQLTPQEQAIEDRFGNDMAWLDPIFQRQATTMGPVTTQNAMQYGITADPAAAARQTQLYNDVTGRGLSADQGTVAQQNAFLQGLQTRGPSGDMAAYDAQRAILGQLGQHGISADPGAAAQQQGLVNELLMRGPSANAESRQAQQNLISDLRTSGPSANNESRGLQTNLLYELAQRGPSANTESRNSQQALMNEIAGRGTTSDAQSEAAQRYAIDQLFGLYRQGGQDAQNRAARASARADSENWMLGQREADEQARAMRGMSSSGASILDLAADRQAAASRMSAADLEADAAAERRALDALLAGTSVAGQARSQADAYQGQNTAARGALANAMRNADDAFANEGAAMRAGLSTQLRNADDQYQLSNRALEGQLATSMRNADDLFANQGAAMRGDVLGQMRSAADAYDVNYAGLQSNLATNMRNAGDAYDQAIAQLTGNTMNQMRTAADTYQVNNDRTAAGIAQDQRLAADAFVGANADRLYNAAALNAQMINSANAQNSQFMQGAWQNAMNQRQAWDQNLLNQQIGIAQGTRAFDANQNTQGFNWGTEVASTDVANRNNAQTNANSAGMGIWTGSSPQIYGSTVARNNAVAGEGAALGNLGVSFAETMASMGAGGGMGGLASMGGGQSQPIVYNSAQTNMARNPWLG
jgi:hypothetical protein